MESHNLFKMREEYRAEPLLPKDLNSNPIELFDKWFSEAVKKEAVEVNAMVLSTYSLQNGPSSRVVLLKEYSREGFIFFTNYESRKGRELLSNPKVSLLFFWPLSMRQVRVEGVANKTSAEYSSTYFHSRPRESQASAIASKQSETLLDKELFKSEVAKLITNNEPLHRPKEWGGVIVEPSAIEFWQGGVGRAHDRYLYVKEGDSWSVSPLYP